MGVSIVSRIFLRSYKHIIEREKNLVKWNLKVPYKQANEKYMCNKILHLRCLNSILF